MLLINVALVLIDVVLLALAVTITKRLWRSVETSRRRAQAEVEARVAEAGLQAKAGAQGVYGTFVAHPAEGVEVEIENGASRTRPGASEPTSGTCVVRVAVPLVDQIVCKAAEADLVLGPLPAVPRVRTGNAPFDNAYAIFVGIAGAAPAAGSYRAAPAAGDVPWVQSPVLDALQDLGLLWMRVQEGRAEFVLPTLDIEDMRRAAAVAAAVVHAAAGRSVPIPGRGPRVLPPQPDAGNAVIGAWVLAVLAGLVLAGAPLLVDDAPSEASMVLWIARTLPYALLGTSVVALVVLWYAKTYDVARNAQGPATSAPKS